MSACGVVIAVIVTNIRLGFLYGPPGVVTGGNFAYTLCGLAHGSAWDSCYNSYTVQLARLNEPIFRRVLTAERMP